eukprot:CAMPEP_0178517406 /NCGR_PEP_ID=MMETSP0696-20121128/25675_1 /TAXON_ID=265572 /ORGANISM="Extubocellulus spinifer, Strain CCMP396" /LENGTH=70 /DNA_ID=CAMNT_0020147837 /DNA_START=21 /DNA_END=231 /DNA_ORIENTATION=-
MAYRYSKIGRRDGQNLETLLPLLCAFTTERREAELQNSSRQPPRTEEFLAVQATGQSIGTEEAEEAQDAL